MSWGPIQLRLKGSRQVEFDGEASPAPGGGAMPELVGPITVTAADLGDGSAQFVVWQPPASVMLLDILYRLTEAFDVDTSLSLYDGDVATGNSYGPALDLSTLPNDSPNGARSVASSVGLGGGGPFQQLPSLLSVTPDTVRIQASATNATGSVDLWFRYDTATAP